MAENTPDNGIQPVEETINELRHNLGAGIRKSDKSLRYIIGLLVLTILLAVFLGFQQYSLSQQLNEMAVNLTNLEVRMGGQEKQQVDLQAKSLNSVIVNEVGTLSAKVSALEKQITSAQTTKKSSTESPKQTKAVQKHFHEVKKGETLYRISQQYGITVDELRRLNKLPPNQPIEIGQKLLVSKR